MLGAVATLLNGCGLRPMYGAAASGQAGPATAGLAQVSVGLIPERSGQLMRLALQERFARSGLSLPVRYDLNVLLRLTPDTIGILQDSSATYLRWVGTADWTLSAQDPVRRTLTTGTNRVVDGQNLFDTQAFATDLESETVQRRVVEALADQIAERLAAWFNRQAATG